MAENAKQVAKEKKITAEKPEAGKQEIKSAEKVLKPKGKKAAKAPEKIEVKVAKPAEIAASKTVRSPEMQKKPEKPAEKETREKQFEDPYSVLKFVLMTEKAVQQIEKQNKLVFVVERKAGKPAIKKSAESAFNAKITGVNTSIDQRGRKVAFIKFTKAGEAGEIAIRLGII